MCFSDDTGDVAQRPVAPDARLPTGRLLDTTLIPRTSGVCASLPLLTVTPASHSSRLGAGGRTAARTCDLDPLPESTNRCHRRCIRAKPPTAQAPGPAQLTSSAWQCGRLQARALATATTPGLARTIVRPSAVSEPQRGTGLAAGMPGAAPWAAQSHTRRCCQCG